MKLLNDQVEATHLTLVKDDNYLRLLRAVYDEQATEGLLLIDDTLAAIRVRDKAKTMCLEEAANSNLSEIIRSLHVVLRRFGMSRKERRNQVGERYSVNGGGVVSGIMEGEPDEKLKMGMRIDAVREQAEPKETVLESILSRKLEFVRVKIAEVEELLADIKERIG